MNERMEALRKAGHATILAFESSCDETAVAIVRDGREALANQILSQIDRHAVFGGVVPEIASRMHVEALDPLLDAALAEAGMTLEDIDAVAVTCGPGLVACRGWPRKRGRAAGRAVRQDGPGGRSPSAPAKAG